MRIRRLASIALLTSLQASATAAQPAATAAGGGYLLPPKAIVDALDLTQWELMRLVREVPPNRSRRSASEAETRNPPPGVSASP